MQKNHSNHPELACRMPSGKEKRFKDFIKPYAMVYAATVLLALAGVFCGLVPYFMTYRLLIGLTNGFSLKALAICTAIILGAFLLQLSLYNMSLAISHKTAFRILGQIRIAITDKMLRLPLGYIQTQGSGHFQHMLIDGTERLEFPLAHAIPETVSNVMVPVGVIGVLFATDWRMALSVLIPAVLTLLFYLPMYLGIMNEFANTYYAALERMNGRIIEYIRANKEIKIFGQERRAYARYEESIKEYKSSTLRLYHRMHITAAPSWVLLSSILISVLCVGGYLYTNGRLSGDVFLLSALLSLGIGASLLKFTEFMDNFYHIRNGNRLIDEILSAPELKEEDYGEIPSGNQIELHHVSFAYEKKSVIQDVSLMFEERKKVAIVGPSGAGKTTIANLLARFWDVTDGSITIGGVDYRGLPLQELMSRISYVTQDTFLFNFSILENIRLGNPSASDDAVINAARQAQCSDFIEALEKGYHTIVGNDGARLSGGQRQRIIIARAILKDAPILILDEATAYADMENQHKIQAALDELCKDKTLIVIAHRLGTIKGFDRIIVLNDGRIHAAGTHEELLVSCGLYQNMWKLCLSGRGAGGEGNLSSWRFPAGKPGHGAGGGEMERKQGAGIC